METRRQIQSAPYGKQDRLFMKANRTRPRKSVIAPAAQADPREVRHKLAVFIRGIPESTHRNFKAACAARGICMRDVHLSLMRRFSTAVRRGLNSISINKMTDEDMDV